MSAKKFEYPNDINELSCFIENRAGISNKSSKLDKSIEEYRQHLLFFLSRGAGNYSDVRKSVSKLRSTIYGKKPKLVKKELI